MNDPRWLRDNRDKALKGLQDRSGRTLPYLEEFYRLDERHRGLLQEVEGMRARRNAASESIAKAKAARDETLAQKLISEVGGLKDAIKEREALLQGLSASLEECLLSMPNIPEASAPVGKSEADNVEVRRGGPEPRQGDWLKDHQAVGEALGVLDMEEAARLSGSRFVLLKGDGARLERALISFMLDLHVGRHGYLEVSPPYLVRPEILEGTGQLPKFKEDMYCTQARADSPAAAADPWPCARGGPQPPAPGARDQGSGEMYLISTAEVPLTNLVRDRVLTAGELPLKFAAYSPCFRQEAGSYGKDTRGMIRVHQFDKVELVWVTRPEDSPAALEELTRHAEAVLRELDLPYRVVELCTSDLGFASAKTYDLEVWMAGEGRWREVSSCSNCRDFQARRMAARFRRRADAAPELVHTLNGSGVAVGRVLAAILEGFQRPDGSVEVPRALRPYAGMDTLLPRGVPGASTPGDGAQGGPRREEPGGDCRVPRAGSGRAA